MNLKNHTYYFGRIPPEWKESPPLGWIDGYYFRFYIPSGLEDQVNFEDACGRMVPFSFNNLCEMRDTLSKMIADIATESVGANYNAVS